MGYALLFFSRTIFKLSSQKLLSSIFTGMALWIATLVVWTTVLEQILWAWLEYPIDLCYERKTVIKVMILWLFVWHRWQNNNLSQKRNRHPKKTWSSHVRTFSQHKIDLTQQTNIHRYQPNADTTTDMISTRRALCFVVIQKRQTSQSKTKWWTTSCKV